MKSPDRPRTNRRLLRPTAGRGERLAGVFLLGLVLFNPPVLTIFGQGGNLAGVPLLFFYLFAAWAALIALMAFFAGSAKDDADGG